MYAVNSVCYELVSSVLLKRTNESHVIKAPCENRRPLEVVCRLTGVARRLCHAFAQLLKELQHCGVYEPK